ncbi:MAG: hypothetical protein ACI3YH_09050 [Eubacteriales bacterium]
MTNERRKRIEELEAEFSEFLEGAETMKEKQEKCRDAVRTYIDYDRSDPEYFTFCQKNFPGLRELKNLYEKCLYHPEDDEKKLAYLFCDGMTKEEKLKALADAYREVTHSGYCDAMAGRLAAGERDSQTDFWVKNRSNKCAIDRYYDWLKEQTE